VSLVSLMEAVRGREESRSALYRLDTIPLISPPVKSRMNLTLEYKGGPMAASPFTEKETEFLTARYVCRLATVMSSGAPHVVPVSFLFELNMASLR